MYQAAAMAGCMEEFIQSYFILMPVCRCIQRVMFDVQCSEYCNFSINNMQASPE